MIKSYVLLAIKGFWRSIMFSLINVIGLSIGISAALVIFLIVSYHLSFDRFEKDGNRIYRAVVDVKFGDNTVYMTGLSSTLEEKVKNEVSGLEEFSEFNSIYQDIKVAIRTTNPQSSSVFKHQAYIVFADEHYFNLVPYKWLAGSLHSSLAEPFKIVLSEARARAYFPNCDVSEIIGKQVTYNDSIILTVSGVVKDLTDNSDFTFKEFISSPTLFQLNKNHQGQNSVVFVMSSDFLVKIAKDRSAENIEKEVNSIIQKSGNQNNGDIFHLQPLADIHFNSNYPTYGLPTAHKSTLYGLQLVAGILLLLASINFINLSTARSSQRGKEIGIRKTIGSSAGHVIFQFLVETLFVVLIATVISILLTPILLKSFENFIPKDLHFDLLNKPIIIVFLIILIIAVTILSGFYPGLILSRINPIHVLKNQGTSGAYLTRKNLRRGLTVSQFFISQVFIIATLVTAKQIDYMLNTDLGYKKNGVICFGAPTFQDQKRSINNTHFLLNKLKSIPGIEAISLANGAPFSWGSASAMMKYDNGNRSITTNVEWKTGDTNYLKLFRIKLLAGRNVRASDSVSEFLINETYLHALGIKDPNDALTKLINSKPIVGVMADFHQSSLHSAIQPLVFTTNSNDNQFNVALIASDANGLSWKSTINNIAKAYKDVYPEDEFEYDFFDSSIALAYENEQHFSQLLKWATGLAIFISCIGLLGFVIFMTNTRTKEIGIRKVLGASVANIVSILSRDSIELILISIAIAVPIAWWAMYKWLENFAYKTAISWWLFICSGGFMALAALIIVSIQVIKAANANPTRSLRNE
ncbi:MAG TPA: FtsX-like permease family protein [Puia sp.]|nr:FtsX-like permease family protein [Puia sp.]